MQRVVSSSVDGCVRGVLLRIAVACCVSVTACGGSGAGTTGSADGGLHAAGMAAGTGAGTGIPGGALAGTDGAIAALDAAVVGSDASRAIDAASANVCGDATCDGGETCRSCGVDCGACNTAPFGNTDIHPDKLGIYMIPDLPAAYLEWEKTERSLGKIRALLPDVWLRWDNETGHTSDSPQNVEAFVAAAQRAGVPMIITASAVDGYDNWWARGNQQPTVSIDDIANGPYLAFAHTLLGKYDNVRFLETINEPDTGWFVADPDDVASWDYYLGKLFAATANDYAHILGPAVAFKHSKIWESHAARSELASFSYHTYAGNAGLEEVGDKRVYVTEYGSDSVSAEIADSPGFILSDLYGAELQGKLAGKIERIFYVNLQKMMRADLSEGDHFALSGQLRTLALYAALGTLGRHVHRDDAQPDFLAADDRHGNFAVLLWNAASDTTLSTGSRHVPATSVASDAALYVTKVRNVISGAAECRPLADQAWVEATLGSDSVDVAPREIEPLAAVLVSNLACAELAN